MTTKVNMAMRMCVLCSMLIPLYAQIRKYTSNLKLISGLLSVFFLFFYFNHTFEYLIVSVDIFSMYNQRFT